MIIKGKSRGNGGQLGRYLVTPGGNDRIRVVEIRGTAANDVPGAILEMDAAAACSRSDKPLYHASINSRPNERLTDEQRMRAVERLEAALGFSGQPRVVVIHEQGGREHCHIVWSRLDLERKAVISDSHNYRKHEVVARALEREFGHERVQGAHVERQNKPRPARTPSDAEMQQAKRIGLKPQQVTEQITGLWRSTATGSAFALALWESGYVLARGDRRDYVVIDPNGGVHSLARRIEGARVADVRARLADIDPASLPSIAKAKELQRKRHAHATERGSLPDVRADSGKAPDAANRHSRQQPALAATAADGREHSWRANWIERERRNQPQGAGRLAGRREHPGPGTGRRLRRSAKFYAHLNQIPAITPAGTGRRISGGAVGTPAIASGEFRGLARWLTASASKDVSREASVSARPAGRTVPPPQQVDAEDGDAPGGDDLGALLAVIADDVHQRAAAVRAGVMADFAGRVAHARKHLSRSLLPGALAAIGQSRKAALAAVSRNASLELVARKKAAILAKAKPAVGSRRNARRRDMSGDGPRPN